MLYYEQNDKMDEIDHKLVRLLAKDARSSSAVLAKLINVSHSTVRRRIRKLINDGTLHIVGVVDPAKFGFSFTAIVALSVAPQNLDSCRKILTSRPEVKWISTTTGRFDIMILGRFRSSRELSDFLLLHIKNIKGLKDSETFICLNMDKTHYMQL